MAALKSAVISKQRSMAPAGDCHVITTPKSLHLFSRALLAFIFFLPAISAAAPDLQALTRCLSQAAVLNVTSRSSASAYTSLLYFSLQNLRYAEVGLPTPDLLIFPQSARQVQSSLLCSLNASYQVRVRSGGHSYEGLSSVGTAAFVIIDLTNLRSVSVDIASKSAWVEAGATLGEIYYGIAQASSDYGFPAGYWPTVGSGGHISGGGIGFLSRKYGTAADNVIDAQLVDAGGRLLNRKSMGEDVFWALRGGGGGSWGIVVAWRLQLVPVPSAVTTFQVARTGKNTLTELVYRWQALPLIAPPELTLALSMAGSTLGNATIVGASFYGLYLGSLPETLAVMSRYYPELNLSATDCKEGRWIDGVANLAGVSSIKELTNRNNTPNKTYFKAKSDFVRKAITKEALLGALSKLEANAGKGYMAFEGFFGGVMERIPMGAIAFPHRAGNLYGIQYQAIWEGNPQGTNDASSIQWIRDLYAYMEPFVSHSPRAAYVNYIDLDLGISSSFIEAKASWGQSYFLSNFPRLARIKSFVDPLNVFNHPQSVPPL